MLTRNDATVENALDLVEVARPLALRHIGFKDVGAEPWLLQAPDRGHPRGRRGRVDGGRLDDARGRIALDRACPRSRRRLADGRRSCGGGLARARRKRDALSALRRQACAAIRRGSAAPPRRSRRNARPLPPAAARASTFSPIARPRPSRSTSSPPAGADCATGARWSSPARSIPPRASPPIRAAGADAFTIGTAAIDASYAPGAGTGRGSAPGGARGLPRCGVSFIPVSPARASARFAPLVHVSFRQACASAARSRKPPASSLPPAPAASAPAGSAAPGRRSAGSRSRLVGKE